MLAGVNDSEEAPDNEGHSGLSWDKKIYLLSASPENNRLVSATSSSLWHLISGAQYLL